LIGDDIITTDGTTLLGSDDKSGIATIMTMVDTLRQNPQIEHGTIAVAFTADEEIGVGIEKFDVDAFGADFAYTVDGGTLGEVSDETWSARMATVTFHGKSAHPGTAKGVMVNSIYAMADYVAGIPRDMLPETTEDRVGFVHPYAGVADVQESSMRILLRDFELTGLDAKERLLRDLASATATKFPGVTIHVDVKENYKNMKEVLKHHPQLMENAFEAARRAGLTPFTLPIRGGTDGSKLTFRGLPCPIFSRAVTNSTASWSSTLDAASKRRRRRSCIWCRSLPSVEHERPSVLIAVEAPKRWSPERRSAQRLHTAGLYA
jgi:tripeptide aminopeptidase